jgi:hypothetical protein
VLLLCGLQRALRTLRGVPVVASIWKTWVPEVRPITLERSFKMIVDAKGCAPVAPLVKTMGKPVVRTIVLEESKENGWVANLVGCSDFTVRDVKYASRALELGRRRAMHQLKIDAALKAAAAVEKETKSE